jgi:hypothetical protein
MLKLTLLILIAASAFAAEKAKLRVFIEPHEGFESYISAAIVKKDVPVTVTTDRSTADFVITSVVLAKEESTGSKVARCIFAYCAGITGQQTATMQLVDAKTQDVAFAYNVKKPGAHNYQSAAEAIAKHMKNWLKDRK